MSESRDSMLHPKYIGGIIGNKGYAFQNAYILHRLPDWLADPAFVGLQPEGWDDVEVFFEDEDGSRREAIQVKDHPVTPSEAKDIFDEFQRRAGKGERTGIVYCFRLASLGVSEKLRPVMNGVELYQARTGCTEAEMVGTREDLAQRVAKLGLEVPIEFLLERVTVESDLWDVSKENVLRNDLKVRLHEADYGLSLLDAEYAYVQLATKLNRWLREKRYISRQDIEGIIQREAGRHPEPIPEGEFVYDVFISYSPTDQAWVRDELLPRLEAVELRVCIDFRDFELGSPNTAEIERAVKASRKTLLILTPDYLKSDWAQFDDILLSSYGLNTGEWRVIPLIIEPCELPERISALSCLELHRGDFAEQWKRLIKTLKSEPDVLLDEDGTVLLWESELLPPRQAFDSNWLSELDAPEGTVRLRSRFYVQRENESTWLDRVLGWGEIIRVKGAHQMGKSSLLARMHQQAKENGRVTLYLDFQLLDEATFSSLDSLSRYMADFMARRLRTSNVPNTYWSSPLSPKDKLSEFVLMELLEKSELPIVLLLDDVDRVFNYEYRDDFFSLIRAWHNERAFEGPWLKLNVVLAYSTEAYLFIRDLNQSPFNVGISIELSDFGYSEVEELNARHDRLIRTSDEIGSLMRLLGGHPYLWRMAFYVMATQGISVSQLTETACNDDGPFAEHLHRYLEQLETWPDLRNAMQDVLRHRKCASNESFYRLRASGLVMGHSPYSVQPRCQLYTRYFGERL